jgi:hypothetical protein
MPCLGTASQNPSGEGGKDTVTNAHAGRDLAQSDALAVGGIRIERFSQPPPTQARDQAATATNQTRQEPYPAAPRSRG